MVPFTRSQHPEAQPSTDRARPSLSLARHSAQSSEPDLPGESGSRPPLPGRRPPPVSASLRRPPFLHSTAARAAPRYLQAEDVLALSQGHGLPQDAGAVGRARRNAAVLTHAALRARRQPSGQGAKGNGGRPLPAGAAQRSLQPPQRGAGAGPGGAGRRHRGGGGGGGLTARSRPVARAAAQRLPHGCPPPPIRIPRPPPLRRRRRQRARATGGAAVTALPALGERGGARGGAGPAARGGLREMAGWPAGGLKFGLEMGW